ncbi:Thioredoxin [Tenacibaculum sp. 190524A02b]|uniref:Thioredoxin n=1 Tax=Tenacibaculum vairaonense TaxID=3137860 RepID=A0ABM9PSL4_9FLAO
MNKIHFLFIVFLSINTLGQTLNKTTHDNKGNLMLLGKTSKDGFKHENFSWFQKNYDTYVTNDNVIQLLKDSIQSYHIKVFYGTWCGDSKRELPKFYKVIDKTGFNKSNMEVIAVDKKPEAYKASPNGEEKGLNIHRVPTFILYKNQKEVARIVEYPKQDFERDLLQIVLRKKYTPNYRVVAYLHNLLQEKTIKELEKEENSLIATLAEFTKGSRELNTYAYKLLQSNQTEKAFYVYKLNTQMYPYKSNVFKSLGKAFHTIKDYKNALKNIQTASKLAPENKELITLINTIKKEI